MGITLTDVLLFGKAQSDDVDKATLVIYRRNILRWSALGGYLDIIVKGVSPLSLPDAIADSLSYVKAFGGIEQNGTPTPDAPVDIVSNNGVLKVSPNLFDQSLFNTGSGGSVLYVSYSIPNGTYIMSTDFPEVSSVTNVFIFAGEVTSGASSSINGVTSVTPRTITVTDGKYTVAYRSTHITNTNNPKDFNWQLEAGSTATPYMPYGQIYTDGTVETINAHGKNWFDEVYPDTTSSLQYEAIYVGDGTFTCSYGMPNQINNISLIYFLPGNVSAGAKNGTNQVDATYSRTVTAVGGYVTIAYRNGNTIGLSGQTPEDYNCMIEKGSTATAYQPYYDGGTATAEMLLKVGDYQDVQSIIDGVVTRNVGVKVFDGTESWGYAPLAGVDYFYITIPNAPTTPNYTVISTHFAKSGSGATDNFLHTASTTQVLRIRCSKYTDTTAWKAWLADQYAAGTPVIIVYLLATPTTESVTGQTLQVTDGDNVLEITQASLNGLELEAEYQAAVSLTIQEVQDANLDPNVQVTIN